MTRSAQDDRQYLNTQKQQLQHRCAVVRTNDVNNGNQMGRSVAGGFVMHRGAKKGQSAKRLQYAALPYRVSAGSRTEIMLITSRETRRWIIPKGWPQKDRAPHRCAAREAFEEAGVVGAVGRRSIGSFSHTKRMKDGGVVACKVLVFPLKVNRQDKEWPEKQERQVKWLTAKQAARTVKHPKLSEIISRLARANDN
jgi:8-oxo-dGTP pyrophosphatase MutT (NUDIX family)